MRPAPATNDHAIGLGSRTSTGLVGTSSETASHFAAFLNASRRSSLELMGRLQSQEQQGRRERLEVEKSALGSDSAPEAGDAAESSDVPDEPGRVERMREMLDERQHETAVDDASDAGDAASAVSPAAPGHQGATASGDGDAQHRPATPAGVRSSTSPQAGTSPGGGAEATGTVAAEPLQASNSTGTGQSGPTLQTAQHGAGDTSVPTAVASSSHARTGSQSGNGGAGLDTLGAAATAKPANGAATAKGGASEFQQLMSQLARQRGPQAEGINAQTARAMKSGKPQPLMRGETVDIEGTGSVRDLARLVRSRIGPNQSSMLIDLSPPELGRVRVDVEMRDGVLTVRFQAATAAGEQAIRGRLDDLRSALELQGVRIDRLQVEAQPSMSPDPPRHDLPGQSQGEAHGQPHTWHNNGASGDGSGGSSQDGTAAQDLAASMRQESTGVEDVAVSQIAAETTRSGVDVVA